jgi:arginine N-succinyltransferase
MVSPGAPDLPTSAPRPARVPAASAGPMLVRPAALGDLPDLLNLAALAGAGLTTLPKDHQLLHKRITKSIQSFSRLLASSPDAAPDSPGGESYLLVLQDSAGKVVGTSGVVAKVGGFEPFYSYVIESTRFESRTIGVAHDVPILRLHEQHDGPCEIGSLFLHPDYRHSHNGRFLQLVRFLFIAEFAHAFESQVVSEIRGVSDEQGRSPFWDALGRHFFGIDFRTADVLSVSNKKFIADLMPDHPIYIPLLPKDAQAVIGQPHPHSLPAVKNLTAEGFTYQNAVDIFDAGPVYACPRDNIRSIRRSRRAPVAEVVQTVEAPDFMMCTTSAAPSAGGFRATKGPLQETPAGLRLTAASAQTLQLRVGDTLRYVELKPAGQN